MEVTKTARLIAPWLHESTRAIAHVLVLTFLASQGAGRKSHIPDDPRNSFEPGNKNWLYLIHLTGYIKARCIWLSVAARFSEVQIPKFVLLGWSQTFLLSRQSLSRRIGEIIPSHPTEQIRMWEILPGFIGSRQIHTNVSDARCMPPATFKPSYAISEWYHLFRRKVFSYSSAIPVNLF